MKPMLDGNTEAEKELGKYDPVQDAYELYRDKNWSRAEQAVRDDIFHNEPELYMSLLHDALDLTTVHEDRELMRLHGQDTMAWGALISDLWERAAKSWLQSESGWNMVEAKVKTMWESGE